jgi:hypothetical protein
VTTKTTNSLPIALDTLIARAVERAGGWIGFDRFMALALYAPGLGYYANSSAKFGHMPSSGSDFVTAPELTPMFGQALAGQVAEALEKTGTDTVWEFGAGSGALAVQLLHALDEMGRSDVRYRIVDLSGTLRERQQQALVRYAPTASSGSASCRNRCRAWWLATKCSTPCRCNCWRARAANGMSAGWFAMQAARAGSGPIVSPDCGRR